MPPPHHKQVAAYHEALQRRRQKPAGGDCVWGQSTRGVGVGYLVMNEAVLQSMRGWCRGNGHTTLVTFALAMPMYQ